MNYTQLFLSFDGRISRQTFWLKGVLPLIGANIVLSIVDSLLGGTGIISLLGSLLLIWPGLALSAKRWHDRGKSGWWNLVALIPLVGVIWAFVETGLLSGTQGQNQFGAQAV